MHFFKRGINIGIDANDMIDMKRKKSNVCIACLGLFEDNFIENILDSIFKHPDIDSFECDTVLTSISLPILLHLRQLSIWIGLLNMFPNHFKSG